MNKYEEALLKIGAIFISYACNEDGDVDYSHLRDTTEYSQSFSTMQELVKRATPMKPHVYTLFITDGPRNHVWNREISENRCGSCDKKIDRDFAFCPYCGQAIDWSDK